MDNIGLYIHIPFCKQKCLYCDFASYCQYDDEFVKDYINAVKQEIKYESKKHNNNIVDTIFIGGGTPTYISCYHIKEVLEEIYKDFKIETNCEISIEANPGTVTYDKLKVYNQAGINRVSFGLQSSDDRLLKELGRIHNFDDFLESYKLARDVGFSNINIDLMSGIPDQSVENYLNTLNKIISLNPEHISAYSLIIEEGTPFYRLYKQNKLNLPDEDDERTMYDKTIEILQSNGYYQYEISNYAKPNYKCRHNLKYWNCDFYLGFGSSAYSYAGDYRWGNTSDPKYYIDMINKNNFAAITSENNKLSLNDKISEFAFMNLRKIEGISIKEFYKRFNKSVLDIYKTQINKYVDLGFMEVTDEYIRLNNKGIQVSNTIMSDMLI